MIHTKNKFLRAAYIDENKNNIIEKYTNNAPINTIAELYGVANSTIYLRLTKWGVPIRQYKGIMRREEEKITGRKHYKRAFSKAFLVRQKENTRVNNEHIKYVKFEHGTEDQKLVEHLLMLPIIG